MLCTILKYIVSAIVATHLVKTVMRSCNTVHL